MTIDVEEVKRRLAALLGDQNLVNEYIRRYGPMINIKYIKEIKEQKSEALQLAGESGSGNDPVYEIELQCPVCNQEKIVCHELRAKSQQILFNRFMMPIYTGTLGYKTVNYSLIYTTVCPRCLFASPDKKDFNRPPKAGEVGAKSQITANVLMALQEKTGERKALVKTISDYDAYFKRPRTAEAAIASIRLSMARAGVEAWYEQPYSFYKLGSYALRIAQILKSADRDNTDTLREALDFFDEAFKTSNCPSEEIEMQTLYTIVALNLKLGDERKANSYLSVFGTLLGQRIGEMKANPALNLSSIDKWMEKARFIWDDRDQGYIFENE